jgi:beta-aspartyl-peptidase (threonine type)
MRSLIVHGGAGVLAPELHEAAALGCRLAAAAAWELLARGHSALDAVELAVRILEDDPLFNAGMGACLNARGQVELDACIVDGHGLKAGAVGALPPFRHPVSIARRVMERGLHVLLVGEGARQMAMDEGFTPAAPGELVTPRSQARWRALMGQPEPLDDARPDDGGSGDAGAPAGSGAGGATIGGDTVGAVAVDVRGHVAAALSTGGMAGKRPGRVGDSPLIGCGAYADDLAGAAAATGHGEAIIRVVLAHRAVTQLGQGLSAPAVAERAIAEMERRIRIPGGTGGKGGLILVDRRGRPGVAFNTATMAHAMCTEEDPAPRASVTRPL